MHERFPICIGLLFFASLAAGAACAQEAEGPAARDWVVAADTTLVQERRDVAGDAIVHSGATLELRGTVLRVGGVLRVEEGARLVLGPSDGTPSRLGPLPGGAGFWIHVSGHVQSAGVPMTLVENLVGHGLDSAIDAPGGLRINGTADLRDLHVRNGTAGLIVGPGGSLLLRDSVAENLFLMGLAVLGNATLENATLRDNIISVSGRGGCHVEVLRSTIHATAGGFQMNGCRTIIRDSDVVGANNAAFVAGPMTLTVEDSVLHGYRLAGVQGERLSNVELRNVELRPAPGGWHGIELKPGTTLVAENVTATGHGQNGVFAQSGRFTLRNSTLAGNGEYGLRIVRGTLLGDLDTIDFGEVGRPNGLGAYSLLMPVAFQFTDPQGHPLGGNLSVHVFQDGRTGPMLSATMPGLLQVQPDAWAMGPDGRPVPATGHRFLAAHPALGAGCIVAPLDLDGRRVLLNATMASPPDVCTEAMALLPATAQEALRAQAAPAQDPGAVDLAPAARADRLAGWLTLLLLGAGLTLVALAVAGRPATRALRRLRRKDR